MCASLSLLALSANHLDHVLLYIHREPLLLREKKEKEKRLGVGDVIKMLPVFSGSGSAMHSLVRVATVLPLCWPNKPTLPVSFTAILMRHS